ncbi:DoxX family protein [Arthrobacter crystallopoietes]|uniref:DoxX family protein n=1 Tax=Micrococcaceae TaxID=1268 RepID=UPI0021C8ED38|nr:DoxX family protein [Arthrobacter sp. Marseille-P9274]
MRNAAMATLGLAILRVVLGFIFAVHGWQKYNDIGIAGMQAGFGQMGVPNAEVFAVLVIVLELVGGVLLILGFLSRPIAALLAVEMIGALVLVHAPNGFFVNENGYELVLILAAAALTIALAGPGRWSLDYAVFGRRKTRLSALA